MIEYLDEDDQKWLARIKELYGRKERTTIAAAVIQRRSNRDLAAGAGVEDRRDALDQAS